MLRGVERALMVLTDCGGVAGVAAPAARRSSAADAAGDA